MVTQSQVLVAMSLDDFQSLVKECVKEALSFCLPTPETKQTEPFIKIKEVCKLLGVSEVTVHNWKDNGLIPFYRISGKIYFLESEVRASLKAVRG